MKGLFVFMTATILFLTSCRKADCPTPDTIIYVPVIVTTTKVSLKMNPTNGKDVNIAFNSVGGPTTNYGSLKYLVAQSWTNGGFPQNQYVLLDFDLSTIPSGAKISKATLILHADTTRNLNGVGKGHSQLSGPNDAYLSRITSAWDKSTVTWNTKPSTDNVNRITIPASTSSDQKYEIDVTALVKDEAADESSYHGFQIQMVDTNYYRQLVFYSSRCEFPNLTPELVVKYK